MLTNWKKVYKDTDTEFLWWKSEGRLYHEVLEELIPAMKKDSTLYVDALSNILFNVMRLTDLAATTTKPLLVSLDLNRFTADKSMPGYKVFTSVLHSLVDAKYLVLEAGKPGWEVSSDTISRGVRSKVFVTEKLLAVLHSYSYDDLAISMHKPEVEVRGDKYTVITSEGNKKKVSDKLDITKFDVQALVDDVAVINRNSQSHCWSYTSKKGEQTIAPFKVAYTRIYNRGSLDFGGRFWCSAGSISRTERESLKVNGQPTVALDFSAINLRLAYNVLAKQDTSGDLYAISLPEVANDPSRDIMKAVALIALNTESPSRHVIHPAIENKIDEVTDKYALQGIPVEINTASELDNFKPKSKSVRAEYVLAKFLEKHAPIKGFLFNSQGLKMQHIDSNIANTVMITFANQNKPIFCVHDGFRVLAEDKQLLYTTMENAYKQSSGGFACPIKNED